MNHCPDMTEVQRDSVAAGPATVSPLLHIPWLVPLCMFRELLDAGTA